MRATRAFAAFYQVRRHGRCYVLRDAWTAAGFFWNLPAATFGFVPAEQFLPKLLRQDFAMRQKALRGGEGACREEYS